MSTTWNRLRCRLALCLLLALALTVSCAHEAPRGIAAPGAPLAPSPWALPTSTMSWNEYACDLIARNAVGQFPASRTLAYMNLAINNALVTAHGQGRKPAGAAAGAAATVLAFLFPKDEPAINARLARESAAVGDDGRAEFTAGVETGKTAAAAVIEAAKSDRAALAWSGPAPTGADKWVSQTQTRRASARPETR